MSNRKLSLQGFFHKLEVLYRKITKFFVNGILRYVLFYQRRGKLSTAGFILPTTVLLILVVALTVGALTFRAYNRNVQVIGDAQQRVIYNAATPAIDRARSKLEFLFDSTKDTRLPSGVPSQAKLEAMLLNSDDGTRLPYTDANGVGGVDAYTFPDETRIDLNGGGKDNAWYYRTDTNGDGKLDEKDSTVVYSIILKTPSATSQSGNTPAQTIATTLLNTKDKVKADNLLVRQAPLSVDGALGCATNTNGGNAGPDGWFEDRNSTAKLRKNFQVDALVIPGTSGGTKATLEFTQDRQLDRGNKWGAWFRHDLEIYPGRPFNWNGAMHTEGSLIIGITPGTSSDLFTAYLISSPASCLYNPPSNSEITVTDQTGNSNPTNLLGLVVAGVTTADTSDSSSSNIHLQSSNPALSPDPVKLNKSQASVTTTAARNPIDITLDPETVMLQNGYINRAPDPNATKLDRNNRSTTYLKTDANKDLVAFGKNQNLPQRIYAKAESTPYVDDLYRADDRWGPKPKYGNDKTTQSVPPGQFGKPIPSSNTALTNNTVPPEDADASGVGLDGYWERRARVRGLRILVGQRLELGNLFTWYAPTSKDSNNYASNDGNPANYEHEGDPLYPITVKPYPTTPTGSISHVDQQRRTLRDNLSAVQSTAIYHAAADQPDYPVACLATTSHPGTFWSLRQAVTFRPFGFAGTDNTGAVDSTPSLRTNFFTGVGTNGWEFETPGGTYSAFKTQIENPSSPLRIALQNLANFAGDHQGDSQSGAFPPTPNDTVIHPYPALSMWGDYSDLKRALTSLGTNFDNLSVADKTYVQTAACTLGMLAYNIDQIQKFDPSAIDATGTAPNDKALSRAGNKNRLLMAKLGRDLWQLMNGTNSGAASTDPEVLPKEQLNTYGYKSSGTLNQSNYKISDYQSVPPEAYIATLRQYLLANGSKPDDLEFIDEMRMAEMIMLNHQIRRDRTFGFKLSPRFGTYSIAPSVAGITGDPPNLPAACDPDQFVFTNGENGDSDLTGGTIGMRGDDIITKASTVLNSTGMNASGSYPVPNLAGVTNGKTALSQYRLALSRLCGTIDSAGTQVLPKFPALYYLFPEVEHDYDGSDDTSKGGYDHRQPTTEPYIADTYIKQLNTQVTVPPFKPISTDLATGRARYSSVSFPIPDCTTAAKASTAVCQTYAQFSRKPDPDSPNSPQSIRVFPTPDRSVNPSSNTIVLKPRDLSQWQLPREDSPKPYDTTAAVDANFSPNLILKDDLTPIAVPFLDRAFFDGRQLMLIRTLDIDLGMLRSKQFGSKSDVWLPTTGIVYAFREDAVREDAISRPPCGASGTCDMDLRNPAAPVDPRVKPANSTNTTLGVGENGISTKAIDKYPDPDRRIHGFRLRNGVQLKRNDGLINAGDNTKGLSFFTDQPVYIQGDFNLHQGGNDDTIGTALEEFTTLLSDNFQPAEFYGRKGTDRDPNFAKPDKDRWRPSEVLADSISILSNGFCDGTIADTFLEYQDSAIRDAFGTDVTKKYPVPDAWTFLPSQPSFPRDYYHQVSEGLFAPGCLPANVTSFQNQNRPAQPMSNKTAGTASGWTWVRENSRYDAVAERNVNSGTNQNNTGHWVDMTAPVKISRAGQPLIVRPRDTSVGDASPAKNEPLPPVPYNIAFPSQTYYNYGDDVNGNNFSANGGRGKNFLVTALASRVNSIIVSGITPSRPQQGYGGLHNFPRFLENWEQKALKFSGSFLQLSYANYATSPFELENIEPWSNSLIQSDPAKLNGAGGIYYFPPDRLWGYDVALQFSPAGAAAARFVTVGKDRSEYYVEPPANDPYIFNLCKAANAIPNLNLNANCPTPKNP